MKILLHKALVFKGQIIFLSTSIIRILYEYLDYRQSDKEDDLLFSNIYGKGLTVNGLGQALVKYGKRRDISNSNTHRFRHIFAKNWIMSGGDVFRLQKILGHSSMEIVKKYVNIYGSDLTKDFDKFNILDRFEKPKKAIKIG